MFELKQVTTKTDWDQFIDLQWKIYKGDPNWVPPLRIAVRDMLDVNKNPFFKHAYMYPLLAYKGGELVGRIVGVIDDNHNQHTAEKTAFFGFFEAINDQKLANTMLDEVAKWARSKGMTTLRGPMNPSTNHECGLLVEGFADTPAVMMTYNPPYYIELFEKWGLTKSRDLYAYNIGHDSRFSERLIAQAERIKNRGRVTLRHANMKDFDGEVAKILEIYNDAWETNWGFVPMNEEEFRHMAKDLKLILDPRLLLMAEVNGETVGFGLALPDGKLLPTGLFKLLWNLKGPGRKNTIKRCRIITLGIKKKYQEHGIGPILYTEYLKICPQIGYRTGEASWILENNKAMNKALELMCGERAKVYRIYDRVLA
jgi:GNAT superfamily N-acetyltransferase